MSLILEDKSRIKILERRKTDGPVLYEEADQIAKFLNVPLHDGRGNWVQLGA